MEMEIKEALAQLDSMEDSHWTADGAPATAAVTEIIGRKVSRQEIIDAAPKFTRENMDLSEKQEEEQEQEEEEEMIDISLLEDFSVEEPMDPSELVENFLKKMDPKLLPQVMDILTKQLQIIEEKEKQLQEMKRKVKLCRATTSSWIKQLIPDMTNQEAIKAYIQSSFNNRMKKSKQIQEILGGLKPSDIAKLDPRAAIDKAFARKTGRGGQRPVR
ncbi:MAG: hypothetical protein Unbinned200contig1000_12 [Prokaryotic dsDNA virus sp.]|jgi:hypothetical protein|nr:hypothetical protein [Flavobacteriaceae bacterium]QDP65272.1 MAG: hypothetical protein Unbinned200contig1000_12 [Prokaryotic dsDNA virus sp.]|tara:strand:+ start:21152 stop:21799 length:648 start_codon:yes stop_codon:yes gene_type:complete